MDDDGINDETRKTRSGKKFINRNPTNNKRKRSVEAEETGPRNAAKSKKKAKR